jgi:lipopolysaccharide export system protein LptA
MLRRVRWLLLAAMVAVAGGVGWVYWRERAAREQARTAPPPPLPQNTSAVASQWEYEIKSGAQSRILVRAQRFEQVKEPAEIRLEGLEMEIRQLDGPRYDLVKSPRGTFRQKEGFLTAEGEVEITLGLTRVPGAEAGLVMRIWTSAVSLDVQTNRTWTDQPARFVYGTARGRCVGASFDPGAREIVMEGEAELEWVAGEGKPPLKVQAAKLIYKEATSDVILAAPSRLERGAFELRGQDAFVKLNEEGQLAHVQTTGASGTDRMPGRRLDYTAGELMVYFGPKAEVSKIEATRGARLLSTAGAGVTEVTADRLDLEFGEGKEGSELRHALAMGRSRVESRPAARKDRQGEASRVLESEVIHLSMRAGGEAMEKVWTEAPGRIEFRPARAGEPFREVKGERFTFDYGTENVLERFRATKAETRTVKRGKDGKPLETRTRSDDLLARFDPKTGELEELDQWNGFQYEEGQRRASAERARYELKTERMELRGGARVWDASGVTAAPVIGMDPRQDVMTAGGGVSAVLQQQGKRGGLIEGSEPLRATAERMRVEEGNNRILFEGNAVLWQGEMRLRAQRVRILRKEERLEAEQEVLAEIPDARGGAKGAGAQRVSVVRAPSMVYEGKAGQVRFAGGVRLLRPGMTVESQEMRGYFRQEAAGSGTETRLERLEAERQVVILEEARGRKRTGRGERADYFLEEERMVLRGGNPSVEDAVRGVTRGAVITWYGRQDRMIVDNEGGGPAVSRVKQKGS